MHTGRPPSQALLLYNSSAMPDKRARQNTILDLVRRTRIDSQENLAAALGRQGIEVSQSTLSRDIRELGLVKAGDAYIIRQGAPRHNSEQTLRLVLREFLVDIDDVDQILVLKTSPGSAATVADALDGARWTGIVGTIAGENTIFVLCRSETIVGNLRTRIRELTG